MKKMYVLLCMLCTAYIAQSQSVADSTLPYLKNPVLPQIKIVQSVSGKDTTWFTNDSLPANKPVVILYFSPDCGHCQYQAKEIIQNKEKFANAFFVWVSYHPLEDIITFNEKYLSGPQSNMRVGRDPKYFIPSYYRVQFTPFIAVYNAQGKFVKEFREGAKPEELATALNN
ncbi:MAG: thioredoxin family protein [Bacteroidota bacterium]|nr:thioredoxin family protein [Bacteroidota bacterium]